MNSCLHAVEHLQRMRGGSQSQLLRCSDGNHYVVKFPNNPQGIRTLANELLCARLARLLGLPAAAGEIVTVSQEFVESSPGLRIELERGSVPCRAGRCFGSRFAGHPDAVQPCMHLSQPTLLGRVQNLSDFLGMLVFDLWTGNLDPREVIFVRDKRHFAYRALMIDSGLCFTGTNWTFSANPWRSLHANREVYRSAQGLHSFAPWLDRLESEIDQQVLLRAAESVPPEWYERDAASLHRLIERLYDRRGCVRGLLARLQRSQPSVFPNWTERLSVLVSADKRSDSAMQPACGA